MAINKAMVTGTRGVMDWFDRNANETSPYFSVWAGRQLLFSWNDDDFEKGAAKLENDLSAIEQNGVGDLLTIKLHPKKEKGGFITDKTPIYASLNFRPAELERAGMYNQVGAVSNTSRLELMLEKMLENQNILMSKMAAEELEEDEEDDQPQDAISGLLNSPHIQSLLVAGVTKMLGINGNPQPAAMAGINELNEDEVLTLVNSLMDKGVTVEHLRKLNEMGSAKLQSLLMML